VKPHRPLLLLAIAVFLSAACRDGGGDRISRERFVAANVALRLLPEEATEEERAAVLERYRVGSADLHRWVRDHADDPRALGEAWQQVAARLDSVVEAAGRPAPLDGMEPPPPGVMDAPLPRPGAKEPPPGEVHPHLPGFPGDLDLPVPPQPAGPRGRLREPAPPS
jgi:hypothetical protein